jgi:hypothetical protein
VTLQDEVTVTGDTTTRHDFLPLFLSASYGHGVDNEGDGATDDNGDNGDGATDDNVDEDGNVNVATDDNGDGDGNGATDDDDDDDDDGNDSNGAVADDNNVNNVNVDNKRNDGCDETKMEEEERVADSVAIHTTIKQITGRGVGRW